MYGLPSLPDGFGNTRIVHPLRDLRAFFALEVYRGHARTLRRRRLGRAELIEELLTVFSDIHLPVSRYDYGVCSGATAVARSGAVRAACRPGLRVYNRGPQSLQSPAEKLTMGAC
jgi:hypothetical protein